MVHLNVHIDTVVRKHLSEPHRPLDKTDPCGFTQQREHNNSWDQRVLWCADRRVQRTTPDSKHSLTRRRATSSGFSTRYRSMWCMLHRKASELHGSVMGAHQQN